MSQNVYVNLKSLKTSVSGDGRTAFDKLKTVFGKNSSNGDKPMQASGPVAYSSRMDMLRVAVQDYLDPTAGMTDAQRERFIKKIYRVGRSSHRMSWHTLEGMNLSHI